jgi:protein TonB
MFHYRLTSLNSRSRMLIAVLLATLIHVGLMNFEFASKPVLAPSVSLPRSVSVFLGQGNMAETPVMQTEKASSAEPVPKEQQKAGTELKKPLLQEISTVKEKPTSQLPQPVLPQKTVKQPAVETTKPAAQSSEYTQKDLLPAPGEAAKAQESATPAEPLTAQENDGVILPGTMQMAYPRYQLNTPPTYPGLARKRGQEGTVFLKVLVNKEGRVDELEIETSSGFTLLDRAAVSAVRKWSFEPGRRGDERVPMWVRVPVTFKLNK